VAQSAEALSKGPLSSASASRSAFSPTLRSAARSSSKASKAAPKPRQTSHSRTKSSPTFTAAAVAGPLAGEPMGPASGSQ